MSKFLLVFMLAVSQPDLSHYKDYFPTTYDKSLLKIINHQDLEFYHPTKAYQIWNGRHRGIYDTAFLPNPNQFRPWLKTAGLDETKNTSILHFKIIPKDEWILWWREKLPEDDTPIFNWKYPTGTVFGEILNVIDEKKDHYPFSIRVLRFNGSNWQPNFFEPFTDLQSLKDVLKSWDYEWEPELTVFRRRLIDSFGVFKSEANFHKLPKFEPDLVRKLLTEVPFRSKRSHEWIDDGLEPTTDVEFHIVPFNYQGAFLDISTRKCASCHSTALKHSKAFVGEWFGRVRGGHGIFTHDIFDESSINKDDRSPPRPIRLRADLKLLEKK